MSGFGGGTGFPKPAAGGGSALPLATVLYAPAALQTYNPTVALAAVDPTNLTIAFTVPASGKVDLYASYDWIESGANGLCTGWVLHGTSTLAGYLRYVGAANPFGLNDSAEWHLTGLTPGPLQLDLAAQLAAVGSTQIFVQDGTDKTKDSPALLQAYAA